MFFLPPPSDMSIQSRRIRKFPGAKVANMLWPRHCCHGPMVATLPPRGCQNRKVYGRDASKIFQDFPPSELINFTALPTVLNALIYLRWIGSREHGNKRFTISDDFGDTIEIQKYI